MYATLEFTALIAFYVVDPSEVLVLLSEICIFGMNLNIESDKYYDILAWVTVALLALGLLIGILHVIILQLMYLKIIL